MKSVRKRFDAAFKAKVALEAVSGKMTSRELASRFGVHPSLIGKWKKTLLDNAPELFAAGGDVSNNLDSDAVAASLSREIDRLKMEVDFLKERC